MYSNTIEKDQYLDISPFIDQDHLFYYNKIKYISFPFPFFKSLINLCISFMNILRLIKISKNMAKDIDDNNFNYCFIHHNKDYVQSPFLLKFLKTKSRVTKKA